MAHLVAIFLCAPILVRGGPVEVEAGLICNPVVGQGQDGGQSPSAACGEDHMAWVTMCSVVEIRNKDYSDYHGSESLQSDTMETLESATGVEELFYRDGVMKGLAGSSLDIEEDNVTFCEDIMVTEDGIQETYGDNYFSLGDITSDVSTPPADDIPVGNGMSSCEEVDND